MSGTVFNIQRYTIHDGPGIRTEIFLKGCPLSCIWCGNPEGVSPEIQMGFYSSKCLGMEKCGLCKGLRDCADVCPADAIKQWGSEMSADEVMEVIRKERRYYESSGGGVTVSGGDPMMQPDFAGEILKRCRSEGIHTCIESALHADWEIIKGVVEHADMIITDIKHMSSDVHRRYTGVGNERILENIARVSETGKPLIIRIPVIPGINDGNDNMKETADFITGRLNNGIYQLQLLGFMRLGEEKYASLGREYPMADFEFDRAELSRRVNEMAEYFNGRGIRCLAGTQERNKRRGDLHE